MLMSSIDKFSWVSYSNLYVCREVDELRAELRKYCHQAVRGSVRVAYKLLKNCVFFLFPHGGLCLLLPLQAADFLVKYPEELKQTDKCSVVRR